MILKMRVRSVRDFLQGERVIGEAVDLVADHTDLGNAAWSKAHSIPDPAQKPVSTVKDGKIVTTQPTIDVIDPTAGMSIIITAGELLGKLKVDQQVSVELHA
jgi:hypothetical protein